MILPFLDFTQVYQVSEAREGVVVEEMLRSGELILPLRNGALVPSKPPLFHWLGVFFARLAGRYDESILRLPSALAAVGCCAVVYLLTLSLAGMTTALFSALFLLSTNGFYRLALDGRVDMVWCFFVLAAVALWLEEAGKVYAEGGKPSAIGNRVFVLIALLCGFAVLAKGPLGLVLPLLIVGCVAFAFWRWEGLLSLVRLPWLLTPLLAVPWYAAAAAGHGGFLSRQIIFENLNRFAGGEGITVKPFWFYLIFFWDQAAPWSLVLLAGAVAAAVRLIKGRTNGLWTQTDAGSKFLFRSSLIWLLSVIFFLSLSAGKRRGYLLPVLPPVAIICALSLPGWISRFKDAAPSKTAKISRGLFYAYVGAFFLICSFLALVGLHLYPVSLMPSRLVITLSSVMEALNERLLLVLSYSLLLLCSVFCSFGTKRRPDVRYACLGLFAFWLFVLLVILNTASAVKGVTHSYKNFAREAAAAVPGNVEPRFVKTNKDESFDGFFFYYPSRVLLHNPAVPPDKSGWYFSRRSWLSSESGQQVASGITIQTEGGRRVDQPDQRVIAFVYPSIP